MVDRNLNKVNEQLVYATLQSSKMAALRARIFNMIISLNQQLTIELDYRSRAIHGVIWS